MSKSSIEELKGRGWFCSNDLISYQEYSTDQLHRQLDSSIASERSIAIHLLSKRNINEVELTNKLISLLTKEKSLYTKIEICSALQKGKEETAKLLIPHLGKIGNNQYKRLPNRTFRKKSYPLPRDIVARTLAKMDILIYPLLYQELSVDEEYILSELIDAIGFMTYYNKELVSEKRFHKLLNTYDTENKLIQWKLITCFSAFPIKESKATLLDIVKENNHSLFVKEANRSLTVIEWG